MNKNLTVATAKSFITNRIHGTKVKQKKGKLSVVNKLSQVKPTLAPIKYRYFVTKVGRNNTCVEYVKNCLKSGDFVDTGIRLTHFSLRKFNPIRKVCEPVVVEAETSQQFAVFTCAVTPDYVGENPADYRYKVLEFVVLLTEYHSKSQLSENAFKYNNYVVELVFDDFYTGNTGNVEFVSCPYIDMKTFHNYSLSKDGNNYFWSIGTFISSTRDTATTIDNCTPEFDKSTEKNKENKSIRTKVRRWAIDAVKIPIGEYESLSNVDDLIAASEKALSFLQFIQHTPEHLHKFEQAVSNARKQASKIAHQRKIEQSKLRYVSSKSTFTLQEAQNQ